MATGARLELVEHHYTIGDVGDRILDALWASGKDLDALTIDDLAPFDQLHMGGLAATRELLALADPAPGPPVLDVGGGLGGAARTIAAELDASVIVLDATEEYCRAGDLLSDLVGLGERVRFRRGDACAIPFRSQSFELVWLQHASMNVADKQTLFAEIHRVLRPGGRLALHEIFSGGAGTIEFPVPWARHESLSFLQTEREARAGLAAAGFDEVVWKDMTEASRQWWRERVTPASGGDGDPPLVLRVLMGDAAAPMARNMIRNLDEGRLAVVAAVLASERAG